MVDNDNPGGLWRAAGTWKPVHALAAGTRKIARISRPRDGDTALGITLAAGDPHRIVVYGYLRRAIAQLRVAGAELCKLVTYPAPRSGAFISALRYLESRSRPSRNRMAGNSRWASSSRSWLSVSLRRYRIRDIVRHQILHLPKLHGLTEAQAQAVTSLLWGASQ